MVLSPLSSSGLAHNRQQSFSPAPSGAFPSRQNSTRMRSNSHKSGAPGTGTFAPTFISTDEVQSGDIVVRAIEGENDFSGKRYVWLKDPATAFVRGWVVEELQGGMLLVQCDDGSVSTAHCALSDPKLIICSNGKSTRMRWTKSIQPSSTRPMTWLSSHT
jgi:myosin protein heavy chain